MVNLSPDRILFNLSGPELSDCIREALDRAAEQHLILFHLEELDLDSVTTKTNVRGTFAKFVRNRVLPDMELRFNQAYVECAMEAYRARSGHISKELFDVVFLADERGAYSYKRSYAQHLRAGLGLFFVALHSTGAITLPAGFSWPLARDELHRRRRFEIGRSVASELLKFVRLLNTKASVQIHPAFDVIGGNHKRREWFLSYATKLLLALGWHRAEDVNIDDMLKVKAAERSITHDNGAGFAFRALLDVLNLAFPGRISCTSSDWAKEMMRRVRQLPRTSAIDRKSFEPHSDRDLLEEVTALSAVWGRPERIRSLIRLPGLDFDISKAAQQWVDLEDLFVSKVARESYKAFNSAVGWWNVYLFHYLPYWFARHPMSSWAFPSSPSLLLKSVFVSRLLPTGEDTPATFVEFMNTLAERRRWCGNGFYSILRQLQVFFEFVERYSEEIPGCEGFTQPLSPHDYPRTARSRNTRKRPVPRRSFSVLLDYYEVLIAHQTVVLEKILAGDITDAGLKRLEINGNVIDTFATSELVGFVPILITVKKTIALQFIPNVLDLRPRALKDCGTLKIPHPHGLNQNLAALHIGLRHNHIQWLDRDRFDSYVAASDKDFLLLFVNTDKQMTKPWTPTVSARVLEIFWRQRRWCELIDDSNFHQEHFYNDNPKTKWPKFRPLFAYTNDGRPHSDNLYTDVWRDVLAGLQGIMHEFPELGECPPLVHLLPPGILPGDANLRGKLSEYGAQFTQMGGYCPLRVYTPITPHSSRISVVSQYITFLPTDLIGKYITGQKPATVSYYVSLEPEDVEIGRVQQAARMRETALREAFKPVLKGAQSSSTYIHADHVNSRLAKSMQANLEETIISHGGLSISFDDSKKGGVELLRETAFAEVAFNKTEVCPFGNNCPPDIVKELGGLRRCSLCPYAVRFVDHLPAIIAKTRQIAEGVDALENVLASDATVLNARFTPVELDALDLERARLCEDLTGWLMNAEVLEVMRQRIASGQDSRNWTVQRPEIIERNLRRVSLQTTESEYLLARLGECIAFPVLESPQVRARFDLMRRELLARAGKLREAFASDSLDPATECAGLLRALVKTHELTLPQVVDLLETDIHMRNLPKTDLRLLSTEDGA